SRRRPGPGAWPPPGRGRARRECASAWRVASVAVADGQEHVARRAGGVTVAALVDRRDVVLVEHVVEAEAHVEAIAEIVAGDYVGDPVALDMRRGADRAVAA